MDRKELTTRTLLFITTMVLVYLLVSFANLQLDFRLWSFNTRACYAALGPLFSLFVASNPIVD